MSVHFTYTKPREPDNDTLVVRHDLGSEPIVLTRGNGDFTCDSRGLTLSQSGSALRKKGSSNVATVAWTSFGLLAGTGGVTTLSRSFQCLPDGSLLMEVIQSTVGVGLYIPILSSNQYFVRWTPAPPLE